MHYILVGKNPVKVDDLLGWANWFEWTSRNKARHVADTRIPARKPLGKKGRLLNKINFYRAQPIRISTVFLGLDHRFYGEGDPVVFETMVFGGFRDDEQYRYCDWDTAHSFHDELKNLIVK